MSMLPQARQSESHPVSKLCGNSETLAERVERLRLGRHMSRIELARAAGVSKSHVHQIETGQRTRMRLTTLAKYANALRVPESYIDYGYKTERTVAEDIQSDLSTALRQATRLQDPQIEAVVGLIKALETDRGRDSVARRSPARREEMQPA